MIHSVCEVLGDSAKTSDTVEANDLHDEARLGQSSMDILDIKIIACLDKVPFHSAY
jgi:hypothetical protein